MVISKFAGRAGLVLPFAAALAVTALAVAGCGGAGGPGPVSGGRASGGPAAGGPASGGTPGAGASGAKPAVSSFGDVHSSWQLQVPPATQHPGGVWLDDGLLFVFEPDPGSVSGSGSGSGSGTQHPVGSLIAYHEATGTKAWSLENVQEPSDAATDPLIVPAGVPGDTGCPQSVTRVNPSTGATMWTAQVSDTTCGNLVAWSNNSYVLVGHTVLNAGTGVTEDVLPSSSATSGDSVSLYGDGILTLNGPSLEYLARKDGAWQRVWKRALGSSGGWGGYFSSLWLVSDGQNGSRSEILNPATGAITGSFASQAAIATASGITALSSQGQLELLSSTGSVVAKGPDLGNGSGGPNGALGTVWTSNAGDVIWRYDPTGNTDAMPTTYAQAMLANSFRDLGRLVVTSDAYHVYEQCQGCGSIYGNPYVQSDGHYAVMVLAPWLYIYKL